MPESDPRQALMKREAAAIGTIMSRWREPWARARRPYVQQFMLNTAYVKGHQYCRHDGYNLTTIPNPKNLVRLTINHMRPIETVLLSKVTQNKPLLDIQPQSDDFVEEQQTIVGRKMLRALELITKKKRADRYLFKNMFRGGTSCKRISYNPDGGPTDEMIFSDPDGTEYFEDLKDKEVRTGREVEQILANMIERNPEIPEEELFRRRFSLITVPIMPGEVEIDTLTVGEFMAPPIYWGLDMAPVMMIERWRSLDFIRRAFPERGKFVRPEGEPMILFEGAGGSRMLPGAGIPRVTGGDDYNRQEGAVVREILIKPTEVNPLLSTLADDGTIELKGPPAQFGVHFIWAGDIALVDLDNPMPYAVTPESDDHDLDFDCQDYRWQEEQSFYGDPFFTDLVPLQQATNRTESQIRESINAFIYPKVLVPTGSKIKKGAFADMPEVIEFAGVPPSYLQPPSLANYVFKSKDDLLKHMNDIAMLHEVTRQGQVPPNVRTAAGLMRLQEADNLALASVMEMYEGAEEIAGQMMLDRVKQFYPEERIVEYIGERNRLEAFTFKREPFFRHRWKVFVHPGSSRPDSKAAKLQEFFELIQNFPSFFQDQQTGAPDKALAARFLNMTDVEEFYQDKDESRQAAEHENLDLEQAIPIMPRPYEEDAVHLEVHYAVMRSPDFRKKPEEVQKVYLEHASAHEQEIGKKIDRQAQIGQQMSERAGEAARQAVEINAAAQGAAAAARDEVAKASDPNAQAPQQDLVERPGAGTADAMFQRLQQAGALNNPRQ